MNISKTSKLDGIKGLQALDTCPGSKNKDGTLVDACKGCYATTGFYHMPGTVRVRLENKDEWKRDEWVGEMVARIYKGKFFRWFDSGDMYSLELAEKILQVMKLTPNTKHWIPTRMYKFQKFEPVLNKMNQLSNVAVRYSSDSITGEFTPGFHGSTIIPSADNVPEGVVRCEAYDRGGKCGGCRACWDKDVPVIGYVAHGHKMKKLVKEIPSSLAA